MSVAALAAASCTGAEEMAVSAAPPAPAKRDAAATSKAGVAVDIGHAQRAAARAGEQGVVTFTFEDRYDAGVMRVSATGSKGLALSPPSPATNFSLASAGPHVWDVFFTAASDGAYYVDIVVSVEDGGAIVGVRSYSAPVVVGTAPRPAEKSDPTGEAVVVLPADEKIRD
jgi:hypothetical protein